MTPDEVIGICGGTNIKVIGSVMMDVMTWEIAVCQECPDELVRIYYSRRLNEYNKQKNIADFDRAMRPLK